MPFSGTGTGIENADDVFFNNVSDNDTLSYNSSTAKWNNEQPTGGNPTLATLPAGSTITVKYSGSWPARPTSRTDIIVQWVSFTSGVGSPSGAIANHDIVLIAESAQ